MQIMEGCLIFALLCGFSLAQFSSMFSNVMNMGPGGSGGTTNTGQNCTAVRSCYPWCARQLDNNGCLQCKCSSSGGSAMSGVNPMYGMNPMRQPGTSGLNPMAKLFSGLNGGMSPMAGGNINLQPQAKGCGQGPTTCPVPQPWCERIIGKDGCVRCICGKELIKYVDSLNAGASTTSKLPPSTTTATSQTNLTASTTIAPLPTSALGSCVVNFHCTKICNDGYKTDTVGCPLCECEQSTLIDTPVDATDPPGKHSHAPLSTPIVTDHVISCPGIFDCTLVCNNGYKTSHNGCPICDCV